MKRRILFPLAALALVAILLSCATHTPPPPYDASTAQAPAASLQTAAPAPASAAVASTDATTVKETVTFTSKVLGGKEVSYIVVRPATLQTDTRYPVLYLLHGAFGSYVDWTENTPLTEIHGGRPFLIINPDGSPFSWYVDSPLQPESQYEAFITAELIADVDARFPTLAAREGRAIAGLSMGGHGALSLTAKHPQLFSSASSLSGILNLVNHADPSEHAERWKLNQALGHYADNPEPWRQNNVYDLVDRFADADVALLFDTGVADQAGALRDNRQVHERLTNRAIVHIYREFPGGHTWDYWAQHIPEHIDFHLDSFARRARNEPPETGRRVGARLHQHYVNRTLEYEKQNEDVWSKPGAPRPVVFLGSSSFEGIAKPEAFPGLTLANRGISGDVIGIKSRGILHRLYCSVFDCRPAAVLIMNGTNDLMGTARTGEPDIEQVVETYTEVVRRIREQCPDIPILLCACFPTRDNYAIVAPWVAKFNERTRDIATLFDDKVKYVDCWTPFAGPDGLQKPEYTNDGLHLNDAGKAVVRPILLEALAEFDIVPELQTQPQEQPVAP